MANFAVLYTSLKNVCPWLELVRFTWEGLIGQQVHYYRKWFYDSGMCFEANDKTKFRVFGTWSIYLNLLDYPSFSHRIRNVSLFTIGTCVCLDFENSMYIISSHFYGNSIFYFQIHVCLINHLLPCYSDWWGKILPSISKNLMCGK